MTNEELALKMLGMDRTKEILSLWREVTYLRHLLGMISSQIPSIDVHVMNHFLTNADMASKEFIIKRFPLLNTTFEENSEKSNPENSQEHP